MQRDNTNKPTIKQTHQQTHKPVRICEVYWFGLVSRNPEPFENSTLRCIPASLLFFRRGMKGVKTCSLAVTVCKMEDAQ